MIAALRILVVFGTRPEAIKLAPLIAELKSRSDIDAFVCATAQHRAMLDQVTRSFGISADRDLDLMRPDQSISDVTAAVLRGVSDVISEWGPDAVVVQGDTASSMAAGLAAFYQRVPVAHVEAGLRTGLRASPFPEEMTRRVITQIAQLHFAPTRRAAENLVRDHADLEGMVFLTGNTVVDAVQQIASRERRQTAFRRAAARMILVTAHRRESFGEPIRSICYAVRRLVESHPDVEVVYPVHLNPNIQRPVHELLAGHGRIHLVPPVDYEELIALLKESLFVMTDSGGIQEEAPVLAKPVLVLRDHTERPEAIEAGTALLAGTDETEIYALACRLLDDDGFYEQMARAKSPFGDGFASKRIADALQAWQSGDQRTLDRLRWTGEADLLPYVASIAT